MTPDTIITAEIKCPRCDAPFSHFEGVNTRAFQCGSIAQRAYMACNYAATLRARVKELEEALKPFTEIKTMRNDEFGFCAHCNHSPVIEEDGWCTEDPKDHAPDCYWIKARNRLEKGTK